MADSEPPGDPFGSGPVLHRLASMVPALSLRTWLVVLAVVSALPILLSLAYSFGLQGRQHALARDSLLRERASLVAVQVASRLSLGGGMLGVIANMREVAEADLPELYIDISRVLAAQSLIDSVTLEDPAGRPLLYATSNGERALPPDGKVACAPGSQPRRAQAPWTATPGRLPGAAGWEAQLRRVIESGPLAGCTLSATLPLDFFGCMLDAVRWPQEWVAAVLDGDRRIVARSQAADDYVGTQVTPQLAAILDAGGNRAFSGLAKDGTPVLGYTVEVPDSGGWHVAIGVPLSVVEAHTEGSPRDLLAISAAALTFACLVALLLGAMVSREVRGIGQGRARRCSPVKEVGAVVALLEESQARLRHSARRQQDVIRQLESENQRRVSSEGRLAAMHLNLLRAQEDERRHIARELHDELGQELAMLQVFLRSSASADTSPARQATWRQACNAAVARLIDRVRGLALGLRPSHLDDLGLAAALRELLQRTAEPSGLAVTSVLSAGDARLPGDIETALYRIAQAAVTNVLRHGEAGALHLELQVGDAAATLTVADNGRGFDFAAAQAAAGHGAHMGLLVMEERARALRGTFQVWSSPGEGTRIQVEIPLGMREGGEP